MERSMAKATSNGQMVPRTQESSEITTLKEMENTNGLTGESTKGSGSTTK